MQAVKDEFVMVDDNVKFVYDVDPHTYLESQGKTTAIVLKWENNHHAQQTSKQVLNLFLDNGAWLLLMTREWNPNYLMNSKS